MMTSNAPLLRVEHVSKHFGRVVALEDVSMVAPAGEVTCILGDNGAGKSTLIRILSGVHRPTRGRVLLDGMDRTIASPADALAAGIATVHQDLALIPLMSVWRNFFLGSEPVQGKGPFRRIDVVHCRDTVRTSMATLGITIRNPDQPVATLSGGERQCVAIARALHFGARILILDEPTAALGVKQTETVLRVITSARDRGAAVLFITHNPRHALAAGDSFVLLRHGHVAGVWRKDEVTLDRLSGAMAGATTDPS